MRRLRGLKALVHDAVDATADLVGEGHASAARTALRVTDRLGPLAEPARVVDAVRDVATQATLASVRGVNRVVERVTDVALDALGDGPAAGEPVPLRSDALGSLTWVADAALGMLNGVVGDHLDARDNGLDLGLSLRVDEADATARVVVLVHGLSTTEWSWSLDAERRLGDPAASYGTLLRRDLGLTPVWVRYNTGRRVPDNGRRLADALEAALAAWPTPVEEVVLLGHSMGGLVARVAASDAHARGLAWAGRLTRIVCLGSPHRGAPLETLGAVATAVLGAVDLPATRVGAALIGARSAGIRDLRDGLDAAALLPPPGVVHAFASGTLTDDPDHVLGAVIGDGLVRATSAEDATVPALTARFGGVAHAQLQADAEVYAWLRRVCAGELDPGRGGEAATAG